MPAACGYGIVITPGLFREGGEAPNKPDGISCPLELFICCAWLSLPFLATHCPPAVGNMEAAIQSDRGSGSKAS